MLSPPSRRESESVDVDFGNNMLSLDDVLGMAVVMDWCRNLRQERVTTHSRPHSAVGDSKSKFVVESYGDAMCNRVQIKEVGHSHFVGSARLAVLLEQVAWLIAVMEQLEPRIGSSISILKLKILGRPGHPVERSHEFDY
jgi:hypothetical protein